MAKYAVEIKPHARKELDRLPGKLIGRIVPRLETLASNPRPPGCKKLKGGENEWRIRIGDHRVVYTIDDERFVVDVTRIRHRSEVYESWPMLWLASFRPARILCLTIWLTPDRGAD